MEKLIFALTKLMLVLAILLSNMPYPTEVLAQKQLPTASKKPEKKPPDPPTSQTRPVFRWAKTPPNLTSVTGHPVGAASRGEFCAYKIERQLTALISFQKQNSAVQKSSKSSSMDSQDGENVPFNVWGLTTVERPTFWFYVPYTKDMPNLNAEFVLLDAKENDVDRRAIALPAKPGIIGVSLPSTVAPLEVGKPYQWNLNIYCSKTEAGNFLVKAKKAEIVNVNGYIQRVNPSLEVAEQLAITSDPRVKIAIYAAAGIWYDSLTLLAQLRLANPNDANLAAD